ncbi:MAG: acetate--CoA ligase family protein, partial [Proteobacteria bacterium]|nr:acetate--CoA ligase family protein [Pseudomonadota bacterium]MBU1740493.1 acetate--CoA ligase family protein [Pseudomonadota bacterium]
GKALAFWVIGLHQNVSAFQLEAHRAGIMAFTELGRAAECLAAAARSRPPRPRPTGPALSPRTIPAPGTGPVVWDEYDAKRLLADFGLPVVDEAAIDSVEEALAVARDWGWPVVVKRLLPGEAHKSEKGLVVMDLFDEASLRRAFDRIRTRTGAPGRIVVQRQVRPDYELIAGYIDAPGFGPAVMLGRGGIHAEVEPDVAFDLAPLGRDRALALMGRLRAGKLFDGPRGVAPLDREALADLVCRLGELGLSRPDIVQIDVNPVAVVKGRPIALDATIVTGVPSGVGVGLSEPVGAPRPAVE